MANEVGYKKLNWQLCTDDELGFYLYMSGSLRKDSAQWAHYNKQGNTFMTQKIERARKISKLLLLRERARVLELEIYGNIESGVGNPL